MTALGAHTALLFFLIGCGAPHIAAVTSGAAASDEVALYRDHAVIAQRVSAQVSASGDSTVSVALAAGIAPEDLVILDRGGLEVTGVRIVRSTDAPADADQAPARDAATRVELAVRAPHAGPFALRLGYLTDTLAWDAAYTMTTNAARDQAALRGAIAIHGATGIALHARARLIDAELGTDHEHTAAALLAALAGPAGADAPTRELGTLALGEGDTRVELIAGAPRAMHSVLVYDPLGTSLDHPGSVPVSDPSLGVSPPAAPRVTESFEIDRDPIATRGLPTGPVRLFERRTDGAVVTLGESQLFADSTRGAATDTITIGTADGVTGHRERRDWARDDDRRRFTEEMLITIDNARPQPINVVIREHLYRGQNWTLAYQSSQAVKEGPQQIALHVRVPAMGQAKVLYVVVYTW